MIARRLATAAAIVALLGCSNHYEAETEVTPEDLQAVEAPQPSYSPSSSHYETISSEAAGASEASAYEASPASASFMGYPCTVDCSGHEAGYQWAEDNGVGDPSDCGGNSSSFIEGCEAYAEEQSEEEQPEEEQ